MSNIINFEFTRHLLNVLKTERFKETKMREVRSI